MGERTVLVIDDDQDVARIMGEVLAHEGYDAVHAGSAAEGVRLLRERHPAVVVVEPYLFGPARWTRIAELASAERVEGTRLLAVTTLVGEGDEASSAGCAGFLPKPVSPRLVLSTIASLIGRKA